MLTVLRWTSLHRITWNNISPDLQSRVQDCDQTRRTTKIEEYSMWEVCISIPNLYIAKWIYQKLQLNISNNLLLMCNARKFCFSNQVTEVQLLNLNYMLLKCDRTPGNDALLWRLFKYIIIYIRKADTVNMTTNEISAEEMTTHGGIMVYIDYSYI